MSEQPPRISEVNEALKQTRKWVDEWHDQFRQTHNLSYEVLMGEDGDIGIVGGIDLLYVEGRVPYFWSVTHEVESHFGRVTVLQLDQFRSDPNHPIIARLIYHPRDFEKLIAISFGWRLTESEVLYEGLQKPHLKIDRFNKATRPGVLFPSPAEFLADRRYTQGLELYFNYGGVRGCLDLWNADLKYERFEYQNVHYEDGRRQFRNGQLITDPPEVFDPIPHLETFARHKAKLPLIET